MLRSGATLVERVGPPVPVTVARAIEADRAGWYARLFVKVHASEAVNTKGSEASMHRLMAEVIANADET
jgi:hypothetical protein